MVGLAPGAHGSNRTGRVFTGDASGEFLYPTLHKFGLASQPQAVDRHDGLELVDSYITAVVRCAPPGNKPTASELTNCFDYLIDELKLLSRARVYLAFGKIAFDRLLTGLKSIDREPLEGKARFSHGAEAELPNSRWLLASYHPSRQNTQTGRLTQQMFDSIFVRARDLAGL